MLDEPSELEHDRPDEVRASDNRIRLNRWKSLIFALFCFVLGALAQPFLSLGSERILNRLGISGDKMLVTACSPLASAHIYLRNGENIVGSTPTTAPNPLSVTLRNTTGKDLDNATITIFPVSESPLPLTLLRSRVGVTSATFAPDYKVSSAGGVHYIETPRLNRMDWIVFDALVSVPATLLVEVSADGYGSSRFFTPSCRATSYEMQKPFFIYSYDSNLCEDGICSMTSPPIEFEYTEEMRDQGITSEILTPYEVEVPLIWRIMAMVTWGDNYNRLEHEPFDMEYLELPERTE